MSGKAPTLRIAAEEYLAFVLKDSTGHRRNKRTAHGDAKWRVAQHIDEHNLADVAIDKLREDDLQEWFDGLEGKGASKNRNLTLMKAILNYAVKKRRVPSELADEWRRVKPIRVERVERRREDVELPRVQNAETRVGRHSDGDPQDPDDPDAECLLVGCRRPRRRPHSARNCATRPR